MMIRERLTKKILRGILPRAVFILLLLLSSNFGLSVSIAGQEPDVSRVVTPPDSRLKKGAITKSKGAQEVESPGKDVPLPSVLPKKSTGYPYFYGGADSVKGRIRSTERDLSQSTRSLNESVRRMNDAINRMRYIPKRF